VSPDTQFWHYSNAEILAEVPHSRGVSLEFWRYDNLVLPDVEGVRDVYVVLESGPAGVKNAQWFPVDDLNKPLSEFNKRANSTTDKSPLPCPIDAIEQKWGEDEVVAECRRKGKDLKVSCGGGLFYVDFDGRRTQVRLDNRAVVRYLVNALEDGS
jgi:hypothetical protein